MGAPRADQIQVGGRACPGGGRTFIMKLLIGIPASSTTLSTMTYEFLKFAHLIGLALMAAGLIGVFISDLRSRQLHDLSLFA
jgi:hypothetical protein